MANNHARIEILPSEAPALLTLITPCYLRPRALVRNRSSVEMQHRNDIEQIRVIDDIGRGWEWVAREVAEATNDATGQYVMGLDDDDELVPGAVDALASALAEMDVLPEVIIVRCEIEYRDGRRVIVPEQNFWGVIPPIKGHISGQCVIVRRDVRMKHLDAFRRDEGDIAIDYPWMRVVLDPANGYHVMWLPLVVSVMQSRGMGKPEIDVVGIPAVAAGGR